MRWVYGYYCLLWQEAVKGDGSLKVKLLFLLLFCLCVFGCGDEVVMSRQVLEIVSPSEAVITAPPEVVWDGIRLNQRYFPREPVEAFEAE